MLSRTLPALLLGLTLTAGCESLGLGGDSNNTDEPKLKNDRIGHDRNDPNSDRGGYDGSVMKYPADFDHGIPTDARLTREIDTNGSVSYKAAHDGKLYIYDVDSKRVVWSGALHDGERFRIDPSSGKASINDQNLMNNSRDLNPDHQYRLYMVRSEVDSSSTRSDNLNRSTSDRTNDDLR